MKEQSNETEKIKAINMIRSITFFVCFLLSAPNANANDIKTPIKLLSIQKGNIKNSKLLGELHQLQFDWENHKNNHQSKNFVPLNPKININDGFVRVDAVAVNVDAVETLEAELRILGMRKISTYGMYISGDFLISELDNASALKKLRSMRLIYAANHSRKKRSGDMASQQVYRNEVQPNQ